MILWAFGCKPKLDAEWISLGVKTIICFSVNRSEYTIVREGNQMKIRKGKGKITTYPKIGGDYSTVIGNLLSFKPNFKIKNTDRYEVSTPDGYFMAYYLDQECWTKAWKSLEGLLHFDKVLPNLVNAHSGLLTSEFFECQIEELNAADEKKEVEQVYMQYNDAIEIVRQECHISTTASTLSHDVFISQTKEITETLVKLQKEQSQLWSALTKLYSRRNHLKIHLAKEKANIDSLADDYAFSNTLESIVRCPVCHSTVSNGVVQKSGLIADRMACEEIFEQHKDEIDKLNAEIDALQTKYNEVKHSIESMNEKYIIDDGTDSMPKQDILSSIAEKSINDRLLATAAKKKLSIDLKEKEIKALKKEQRNIKAKVNKDAINSFFCSMLEECQNILGLDYSSIKNNISSPTDYNKVLQGGAADKTRSILSYYAALYLLIRNQGNEVIAPLIIDTPYQQEQSDDNEVRIMSLIDGKLVDASAANQIFLCAKKDEGLDTFIKDATVFELTETKSLLRSALYQQCLADYEASLK